MQLHRRLFRSKFAAKVVTFALAIAVLFGANAALLPQVAQAATLDVSYLTLAPGSDETQLNFSWHTSIRTANPVVRIWETNSVTTAVEFTGIASASTSGLTNMYYNRATATGLKANTAYTYQLGDGNGNWSIEYTTDTGDPTSFSFIVVGDPQIGSSGNVASDTNSWLRTMNIIAQNFPNAAFMAGTGDQIETSGTLSHYTGFFSAAQMSSLPFASAMGNHEGSGVNTRTVYNPPNADGVQNYWYRYGDTLFMVWNCTTGNAAGMRTFLSNAIAENQDATWRILNFHYDVYGQGSSHALSDGKTYRDTYVPVIDEFDIDVVFNGHDHFYSRSFPMKWSGSASTSNSQGMQPETFGPKQTSIDPTGTVYFSLSSSTGSKYYSAAAKQAYTAFMPTSQSSRPQFSVVDMTSNTFTCKTYQIESNNSLTLIDSYTITKSADKTALNSAIETISAIGSHAYTNAVAVALTTAQSVSADAEATQLEVDAATLALQTAIDCMAQLPWLIAQADKSVVRDGQYFNVNVSFSGKVNSNAAVVSFTYDSALFDYRGFTPAAGVTVLDASYADGMVSLTVMVDDYNTTVYGQALFSVADGVKLSKGSSTISVRADFVVLDYSGKGVVTQYADTTVGTLPELSTFTLIDLSNAVDAFGFDTSTPGWDDIYYIYDIDFDGIITINDIYMIAKLVELG